MKTGKFLYLFTGSFLSSSRYFELQHVYMLIQTLVSSFDEILENPTFFPAVYYLSQSLFSLKQDIDQSLLCSILDYVISIYPSEEYATDALILFRLLIKQISNDDIIQRVAIGVCEYDTPTKNQIPLLKFIKSFLKKGSCITKSEWVVYLNSLSEQDSIYGDYLFCLASCYAQDDCNIVEILFSTDYIPYQIAILKFIFSKALYDSFDKMELASLSEDLMLALLHYEDENDENILLFRALFTFQKGLLIFHPFIRTLPTNQSLCEIMIDFDEKLKECYSKLLILRTNQFIFEINHDEKDELILYIKLLIFAIDQHIDNIEPSAIELIEFIFKSICTESFDFALYNLVYSFICRVLTHFNDHFPIKSLKTYLTKLKSANIMYFAEKIQNILSGLEVKP